MSGPPICADCGRELPTDTPWTVTVTTRGGVGAEVELHGLVGNFADLRAFADAVKPLGLMVEASPLLGHDHGA